MVVETTLRSAGAIEGLWALFALEYTPRGDLGLKSYRRRCIGIRSYICSSGWQL